jgi:hypothetical protein
MFLQGKICNCFNFNAKAYCNEVTKDCFLECLYLTFGSCKQEEVLPLSFEVLACVLSCSLHCLCLLTFQFPKGRTLQNSL